MSAPKRKREVQVNFRVSPEELALIEQKMSQLGTKNREAYLRKMALILQHELVRFTLGDVCCIVASHVLPPVFIARRFSAALRFSSRSMLRRAR